MIGDDVMYNRERRRSVVEVWWKVRSWWAV